MQRKVNWKRFVFLFIFGVCSYNCFSQDTIKIDTAFFTDNDIPYETQVLYSKYISNRLGAKVKRVANESSIYVGRMDYGENIDIIEEIGDWVGIRVHNHQIIKNSKGEFERIAWEKFYVRVKDIGESNEIKLDSSDVYIADIYKNDKVVPFNAGEFFSIELVSKKEYEDRLRDKVEFVIYDTLSHIKENGKLTLKTKKGDIELVDTLSEDTDSKIHYYVGQIPQLNKYIVKRELYEYQDNLFIDKTTGEITYTNYETYLSSDKKYVVAFYIDPYDVSTSIQLYEVKDKRNLNLITEFSFTKFMLLYDKVNYFTNDNYLYLAINSPSTYFQNYENNLDDFQYIKIKILKKK